MLAIGLAVTGPALSAQSNNRPVTISPAANLPLLDAENRLSIHFEARSNRLQPSEETQLDRLAKLLNDDPDTRLRIHVPNDGDQGTKRFTASRLLILDQELADRGIDPARVSLHKGGWGTGPIVLTVVWPSQFNSLNQFAATDSQSFQPAADTAGQQPMPLLPAVGTGDGGAANTATANGTSGNGTSGNGTSGPQAPAEEIEQKPIWTAEAGKTLYQVLNTWATTVGWTVAWNSDREYPIEAGAEFIGEFVEVSTALIEGFASAKPAPLAQFFKGNRVLLVTSGEGR